MFFFLQQKIAVWGEGTVRGKYAIIDKKKKKGKKRESIRLFFTPQCPNRALGAVLFKRISSLPIFPIIIGIAIGNLSVRMNLRPLHRKSARLGGGYSVAHPFAFGNYLEKS